MLRDSRLSATLLPSAVRNSEESRAVGGIVREMRLMRSALLCCLCGLLVLAGVARASGDGPAVIRVGILTSTSDAPLWIADKYGYFKDEGLSVQFLTFNSGEAMIAPLATGQLDVGGGSAAASLYNAVARGSDVRLVADLASDPPGYGFDQMIIRADLVKSGKYKSIKDLKGMTIATNALGSPSSTQLLKYLAKGGLKLDDIKHIFLPYTQHEVALHNGSLDAANTIEPFATDAVKTGTAVRLAGDDEFYPNQEISVVMYGGAFVREHRDLGVKFMRAFIRGARFYNDALAHGKLAGPNADAVIKLLNDQTKMDSATLRDIIPPGTNPDGKLNVASLRDDLADYKEWGLIEGAVTADQTVDTSFAADAVKGLGPYHRRM
jgi:NitT/TauT family transport system substrate-binding protein